MVRERSRQLDESSDEDSFFDDEEFDEGSDDETPILENKSVETEVQPPKLSRHLLQLKERLGLDQLKKNLPAASGSSKVKPPTNKPEPLVVVYQDPRKRKKAKKPLPAIKAPKPVKQSLVGPEFNIHKAKHEMRRLVISGTRGKMSKQEAQAALAISLGALPHKQKPVNYKVLQQMKKKEAEEIATQKEQEQVFVKRANTMAKKKDGKNKSKNKNKVINFDTNLGKISNKNSKKKFKA